MPGGTSVVFSSMHVTIEIIVSSSLQLTICVNSISLPSLLIADPTQSVLGGIAWFPDVWVKIIFTHQHRRDTVDREPQAVMLGFCRLVEGCVESRKPDGLLAAVGVRKRVDALWC